MQVVKIDVDVGELVAWCTGKGMQPDGQGRCQFAAAKAAEIQRGSTG